MSYLDRKQLYEAIYTQAQALEDEGGRDHIYYLKVLNYIFSEEYSSTKQGEELKKKINHDLERQESLFAYTGFLASRQQFNHTWNYLRKQKDAFVSQMVQIEKFIDSMLENVGIFQDIFAGNKDVRLKVDDMFTFSFKENLTDVKPELNWDNCGRLFSVGDEHYAVLELNGSKLCVAKFSAGSTIKEPLQLWKVAITTK